LLITIGIFYSKLINLTISCFYIKLLIEMLYHYEECGVCSMVLKRLILATMFWASTLILLSGCKNLASAPAIPQKSVTTSISPLADLIRQVAGNKVKVINLVPSGTDPHDYEPSPDDIREVSESSLFFANGVGEELYLNKLINNAANPNLRTVVLSNGLTILGKEQGSLGNPHLWLNVQNAEKYVQAINTALCEVYPSEKAYFQHNTTAYLVQLRELDQWIQNQISGLPPNSRKMVVLHDAWSYYAKQYGLTFVQPLLHTGEGTPSAKDYADLINLIRRQKIRAVFGEAGFNPKLAEQLASEAGVRFINSLHDDTLGNTSDTDSYIGMMKSNTNAIVSALKS
jgi:manganese/iron transport system substrate-binding protein